ncbi:MAG: hypothetical protein K6F99_05125 [Lachnospiraceae bacterium]|nr:hypothetical protein [Lachnospiraceae bacterium]
MRKKHKQISMAAVTLVMTGLLCIILFITKSAMDRYEDGIVSVCATQQDSYVQLVIDQINLKENRSNQEIIQNILSTLDASTNRYWTFTQDKNLLFIKDTLETNKYKAYDTDAYYSDKTAHRFIEQLRLNVVTHSEIRLNGKDYVASGVRFNYNGEEYQLCLLTNRSVLMDNNEFLEAKVELSVLMLAVFFLFYILPIVAAGTYNKIEERLSDTETENRDLNGKIIKLNRQLENEGEVSYDSDNDIFDISLAPEFLGRMLGNRSALPIGYFIYSYKDVGERTDLWEALDKMLTKQDIRFEDKDHKAFLILSMKSDKKKTEKLKALETDFKLVGYKLINKVIDRESVVESFKSYLEIKMWSMG